MKLTKYAFALLLLSGCGEKISKVEAPSGDAAFENYKAHFVEALWQLHPNWASSAGYHKYDSVLTVPDQAQREKELAFAARHEDSLKRYDVKGLNSQNATDLLMMRDFLEAARWNIGTFRSYEWIPSHYNVSEGFAEMLNNNYDSLDNRLRNFSLRLRSVPAYYEAAKSNLKVPTAEHTALAIDQNLGGMSIFGEELETAMKQSALDEQEKTLLRTRSDAASQAMKRYAEWLKQLKNPSPRSFRLGKELYMEKFSHDIQSRYTAEDIYQKALARKAELHKKMSEITSQLWPKYFGKQAMPASSLTAIRRLIDTLSLRHVSPDSFQVAIEKQIPELTDFVKRKDLLYLDPSKPLVVRKEPAYMAGIAGASINSPGPYDKKGNTYYNVGSMNGWTKERAESYLREYNHWILQILNIHEAIPGHYAQLVYSNKSPSIIKSIFGNGAMVEGWAVYTELMMLENGYGGKDDSSADPEMWLMYYKWNLRSTCNTILDYGVHVNNLSREDAIRLLTEEAFQQKAEAEGKWRRATLSQVQLCSYFTGFMEIYELREELKKKMGDKFHLKKFHEQFLSYGSAPVKYIREMMLGEIKKN
jgi:uncharacterized protein (DUF885 family)